ncbi:hypothetical protein [Pseudomonas brassicacearum]|uniref:hypothetical protein n=1 Tax=Pseudomonas brassicacearum TaxID=930166 RepID=UPI0011CD4F7D|nr:hypothetical protein [Pseudomonas brassicacearum]
MLSRLGGIFFSIAVILAALALPVFFFIGITRAYEYFLPPLISFGWICLAVVLILLLPLSAVRKLRPYTGTGIYISSYVFGLILFLYSVLFTWSLWGGFWAFVGIAGFGGLIVPFAMIATMSKGLWVGFFIVLGLLVLTWTMRISGLAILTASEKNEM